MSGKSYNRLDMLARLFVTFLLIVVAAGAQKVEAIPTVELNGGMQAQILSLGRDTKSMGRPMLTATVKIANNGKDYVSLLLFGSLSAVDNAGGRFDVVRSVAGVAYCPGPQTNPPSTRLCVGIPRVEDQYLFPLRGYSEIDPGKAITIHFALSSSSPVSKGDKISLSVEMAYRLVSDLTTDADVPDKQKLKLLRFSTLSFEPVAVTEK